MRRYGNTISYSTEVDVDVDLDIDEFFEYISDDDIIAEVYNRGLSGKIELPNSSLMMADAQIEAIGDKLLKWLPRDLRYLVEYVILRNQALVLEEIKKDLGQA